MSDIEQKLPIITECAGRDPLADYAGHCPACHGEVWHSAEGEHGPIWVCPTDLHPDNPHHTELARQVSDALKAVNGCTSNCWMLYGHRCPVPHMPLHADCYEGERPW